MPRAKALKTIAPDVVRDTVPPATLPSGVEFGVRALPPQECGRFLERAGAIKKLPRRNPRAIVERKAKLTRGQARIDGDPVIVLADGTIAFGADKLYAALDTGIAYPTVVITGLTQGDPAISGDFAKRTRADFLKAEGVENPLLVSNVYNILYLMASKGVYHVAAASRMSHEHLKFYQETLGDLADEIAVCAAIPANVIPRALAVACLVVLSQVDHERAMAFFRQIGGAAKHGADTEAHPAAALLVKTLRAHWEETVGTRRPREVVLGYVFEAWHHFVADDTPRAFRFQGKKTGRGYIDFPEIVGLKGIPVPEEKADVLEVAVADRSDLSAFYQRMVEQSGVTVALERIVPDWGAEILDRFNPRNRAIRPSYVDRYRRMMRAAKWELNGKTIKFNKAKVLRDGQHRILAGVQEQVAFDTFVVYGLDEEVFVNLDQSGRVTLREVLARDGFHNAQGLAAALSAMALFPEIANVAAVAGVSDARISDLTYEEQRRFITAHHPGLIGSAERYGGRHYFKNLFSSGLVVAMHYVLSREDPTAADAFFEQLKLEPGEGERGHPAQTLRQAVTNHVLSARRMLPSYRQAELIRLAFAAMRGTGPKLTNKAIAEVIKA